MRRESQARVEPIFHDASQRPPGPERCAYLDGACGDDGDLRERVELLLEAHDGAADFLDAPAVTRTTEGPGSLIGPYKLLQEIGEGGMGVVYMAEQESPVRRKVALKVIKLGMDTKQVIARFEAERQALALMDHGNIARVFDAGATDTGRPYFVMELVRGVPIDEYCDTHKLSTTERLGLFVEVCHAVQHAHQKGIIHRDIKPNNVMVTSHDGRPVPKIIDFGVAKATNQRLTEHTLFTEYHQIIGTPEYMSPEQADMAGLDVDTRSDIYSLGVLLYQLLTGTTPVSAGELRTAGYGEMSRMIREDEPPVPSTRVSTLGAAAEQIANRRRCDRKTLSRRLSGDLDWIVMRSIEKDRTRRYDTASSFAEDVERFLGDHPVQAGPPGSWYRIRKFAHRNRRGVLASVLFAALLGLGMAGTGAGFLKARSEAQRSARINASLQDVLAVTGSTDPGVVGEAQRAREQIRELFGKQHGTYAAVLDTIAQRLYDGGDFERAVDLCREAISSWETIHGKDHPNVAMSLGRLGSAQRALGEEKLAEATLRRALAIFDARGVPGLVSYQSRIELAELLTNRGEYVEADALLGGVLGLLRESPSPPTFRILTTLEQRYLIQTNQGAVDAGETIHQIYEESRKLYGEDSRIRAVTAMGYGKHLMQSGDHENAEPLLREAIQRFKRDPNPPRAFYFAACDSLFQILRSRTDEAGMTEADEALGLTLDLGSDFIGAGELATTRRYLATRLAKRGLSVQALEQLLRAHDEMLAADSSVSDREQLRDPMTALAMDLARQSGLSEEHYDRAREAIERALSEEPGKPAMVVALGAILYRQGELEYAAETLDSIGDLSRHPGGLARSFSPGDRAFRAMVNAKLGREEAAREELAGFRKALNSKGWGDEGAELLREVESVLEGTQGSGGGG